MAGEARRNFIKAVACGFGVRTQLMAAAPAAAAGGVGVFNVRDHGAQGDGVRLDTSAIRAAVDACGRSGGGIVLFPNGKYLTGTIVLRDNVTLYLAPEAILLGSPRIEDFLDRAALHASASFRKSIIFGANVSRVAIAGQGTIDGQGGLFKCDDRTRARQNIYLEYCKEVCVEGITLKNSGAWVSHYQACDDLFIRGIKIDSIANYNNDGIDIDGCQDVSISDCHIVCSDDAICLKSELTRPCKNITITNCVIKTRWGAVKFGTPSLGGFENITVSNCAFYDTYGCAIKLLLVDGGVLDNVVISDITMDNVTGPIFLRLGNRGSAFGTGLPQPRPAGVFRNVLIRGIRAKLASSFRRRSLDNQGLRCENCDDLLINNVRPSGLGQLVSPEAAARASDYNNVDCGETPAKEKQMGSIILGIPGHLIENVMLDDIHITHPGGGTLDDANFDPAEHERDYPDYQVFAPAPAYGFYVRHARGITLNNVWLETATPDFRPAVFCDDVEELDISGLRAMGNSGGSALVRLRQAKSVFLRGCRPLGGVDRFLRVEGEHSAAIGLAANDFRSLKTVIETADSVPKGVVQSIGNLEAV